MSIQRHWLLSIDGGVDDDGEWVRYADIPGWRPIETIERTGGRDVVVLISTAGPNGYVTDPWTGWANKDGTFARWPHEFPPTHWMPLPEPPRLPVDEEVV